MAETAASLNAKAGAAQHDDANDKLVREAKQRLADCRTHKSNIEHKLRAAYFFAAPQRQRETSSASPPSSTPPNDEGECNTSLGMEVSSDFVTEMINTFIPATEEWALQKAGADLSDDEAAEIQEIVPAQTTLIFDTIKASNFYPAAALTFDPDLALGTVAMWVDDVRSHEPIVCQPVPLRELEINIGPHGDVDDRFVVQHTRARLLPGKFRNKDFPSEVKEMIEKRPNSRVSVTWGYWRLWDRDEDIVWQSVVLINNKHLIDGGEMKGEGSCPLIVGRFGADPMFPHGSGPMIRSLPEFRRLNETEVLKIENYEALVRPPYMYPDDGVVNLSAGLEAGLGYAVRPGSERAFGKIDLGGSPQAAEMSTQEIERRIRRLFFVDFPQQTGDTPPTRAQWLDETLRAQRRIGTPGLTFWREFPAGIFLRFKWLLEKRGKIQAVKINGKDVALVPYNPAESAQASQDVQVAFQIMEAGRNYFPQVFELFIDQQKTLENIKRALRDKIVVVRGPQDIKSAAQQLGGMLQGGAGGGQAGPIVPAGAGPMQGA